jgi:hypothetical protein
MSKVTLEQELSEFDVDTIPKSAKDNLVKLAAFAVNLADDEWRDYERLGALDLKRIAQNAQISRSSIYQNEHIKKYILAKSQMLLDLGLISQLPFAATNKKKLNHKGKKPSESKSDEGNNVNEELINSKLALAEREVRDLREIVKFFKGRDAQIFSTGRMPY